MLHDNSQCLKSHILQSRKYIKRHTKRKSRLQWPIPVRGNSQFPLPIGRRGAETGTGVLSPRMSQCTLIHVGISVGMVDLVVQLSSVRCIGSFPTFIRVIDIDVGISLQVR